MRNARGNARWWTTGVSLRGWSLELGPIGSQCLEDRPGTPSRGLISTHLVRRPIGSLHRSGSFLHREHTLRRVLMRNGISGAFIVSFRFFFLSLFLFPLPLANFSPLSRWVYPLPGLRCTSILESGLEASSGVVDGSLNDLCWWKSFIVSWDGM